MLEKQKAIVWKTDDGNIRIHELKTSTELYNAMVESDVRKKETLEIRRFDRDFRVEDFLKLQEYNPKTNEYTGRETWRLITHILTGEPFLSDDIVVMSLYETMPSINF